MGGENNRPLILVTNDDGYRARGISRLTEAAMKFGNVVVISAEEPMSGMSHAITTKTPLRPRLRKEEEGLSCYVLNGTPVDGVKLAFNSLLKRKPDLLLSGINHGSNASTSVVYSGTMAAAIEGAINNVPSVGFSLLDYSQDANFNLAGKVAEHIIEQMLKNGLPRRICLNVNIPAIPEPEFLGLRICRQADGYWQEEFDRRVDPHGREYYWLTGFFSNREPEAEDTDEWALKNNYASIVPVNVDFTNHALIRELKGWEKADISNEESKQV
ncbi:MAG: 5'/3'-nucleotidase SurE [Bacteroidales bacterium]|nr:5'/3'-nucleotidase SurE [Bacteroidales bacterium]